MFTGVPLHQLAVSRPPGTPYVGLFHACSSPPPQVSLDQPLAQRLPAHLDPVLFGQLFGCQRGSVVVPQLGLFLLSVEFHRPPLHLFRRLAIRGSSPQSVTQPPVAPCPHPNLQFPY